MLRIIFVKSLSILFLWILNRSFDEWHTGLLVPHFGVIACGGVVSFAVAFHAPIGFLFALEEVSWWQNALPWRTIFIADVVTVMIKSFTQFCWGNKYDLFD